jgi:hypothetical protein
MRDSIIAIVIFPFVLIALVGFYILLGIFIICAYIYNGILWLFPYTSLTSSDIKKVKRVLRLDGIDIKKKS